MVTSLSSKDLQNNYFGNLNFVSVVGPNQKFTFTLLFELAYISAPFIDLVTDLDSLIICYGHSSLQLKN
ncbi:MAG TPA: hypothetical protein VJL78_07675 [Candidatus Nitrosocosmicus sp.]|nr:hypothetical protein [Candidatus Nitrosocosmicus sp.]